MDRFARTVREGLEVIENLLARGVLGDIMNMGLLDNAGTGKLLLTVMLAISEFEASQISERCRLGEEMAKANNPNYREGRPPKFTKQQIEHAMGLLEEGNLYRKVSDMMGISVSTLTRAKRLRNLTRIDYNNYIIANYSMLIILK